MTLSLKSTLLSFLSFERSILTLYVNEKVGASEGEYQHRHRQSTVRHHLSDFVIQVRAVGKIAINISAFCNSGVMTSTSSFTALFTAVTLCVWKIIHVKC